MQSIFLIAWQLQVAPLLPMLAALSSLMQDWSQCLIKNKDGKEERKIHLQAWQQSTSERRISIFFL